MVTSKPSFKPRVPQVKTRLAIQVSCTRQSIHWLWVVWLKLWFLFLWLKMTRLSSSKWLIFILTVFSHLKIYSMSYIYSRLVQIRHYHRTHLFNLFIFESLFPHSISISYPVLVKVMVLSLIQWYSDRHQSEL